MGNIPGLSENFHDHYVEAPIEIRQFYDRITNGDLINFKKDINKFVCLEKKLLSYSQTDDYFEEQSDYMNRIINLKYPKRRKSLTPEQLLNNNMIYENAIKTNFARKFKQYVIDCFGNLEYLTQDTKNLIQELVNTTLTMDPTIVKTIFYGIDYKGPTDIVRYQ